MLLNVVRENERSVAGFAVEEEAIQEKALQDRAVIYCRLVVRSAPSFRQRSVIHRGDIRRGGSIVFSISIAVVLTYVNTAHVLTAISIRTHSQKSVSAYT